MTRAATAARPRLRVLLADDHAVVLEGLCRVIERAEDMTVVLAVGTGREAVEGAREHRPDVIVMDVQMPDEDGITATRKIVAANPAVRVLVLSTYDVEADIVRAFEAGAQGYLLKDASAERLVDAIRSVARGDMVLAGSAAAHMLPRLRGGERSAGQGALTARELEVLQHVAKGETNRAIARALRVSEATVKTHLLNAFAKLQVDDRTAAVTEALRRGILRLS